MKRLAPAPLSARWRHHARHAGWLCALGALGGCAVGTNMGLTEVRPANVAANATLTPSTRVTRDLVRLPPPRFRVPVAVYAFRDQTGQFKPSPDSNLSTAVTQGAATILVKSLLDSGWYLPIEREGFQNLLNERRVARAIETPADKGKPGSAFPQLVSASFIIEGGIVGFESNVRTGGDGASLLGIGGSTRYRVDQVTVNLRCVDVRTGQIASSVSVTKTIYSYEVTASVYKFIAYKTLLQAEGGFTSNEPSQLAVKEAIESAVIHLTVQGVRDRIWALHDEKDWLAPLVQGYAREADNDLQDPDVARERAVEPVPMRQPTLVMASPVPLGVPANVLATSPVAARAALATMPPGTAASAPSTVSAALPVPLPVLEPGLTGAGTAITSPATATAPASEAAPSKAPRPSDSLPMPASPAHAVQATSPVSIPSTASVPVTLPSSDTTHSVPAIPSGPVLAPPDRLAARQEPGRTDVRSLAFQLLRAPLLPQLQFPEPLTHANEDRPVSAPVVAPPDRHARSEPDDDPTPAWTKAALP